MHALGWDLRGAPYEAVLHSRMHVHLRRDAAPRANCTEGAQRVAFTEKPGVRHWVALQQPPNNLTRSPNIVGARAQRGMTNGTRRSRSYCVDPSTRATEIHHMVPAIYMEGSPLIVETDAEIWKTRPPSNGQVRMRHLLRDRLARLRF
jgi:hypothetical protein